MRCGRFLNSSLKTHVCPVFCSYVGAAADTQSSLLAIQHFLRARGCAGLLGTVWAAGSGIELWGEEGSRYREPAQY